MAMGVAHSQAVASSTGKRLIWHTRCIVIMSVTRFVAAERGLNMKQQRLSILIGAAAAATMGWCGGTGAQAPGREQLMIKSSNWATQAGDYANHRYSDLKQIDSSNVGQLQVAWTMSTGVLRGHEGWPLVIGGTPS